MATPLPLSTPAERLRALAVFGSIAAISFLHVAAPSPLEGHHMERHGLHSALEGLYYIPLLLAGYWWGGLRAGACGLLVSGIYGIHTSLQLGGVLDPANRGRLLALAIFPAVAFTTGRIADRLRRESQRALDSERQLRIETQHLLEAERQLRRAEMLAALGELSAGLAHEIRNPLAAIRGAAEVVSAGVPAGSRDEEFSRLLLSEVDRLDRVVSDFLRFARPGRPGEELADPVEATKATFALLRSQAEKSGVSLRLEGDASGRFVVCPPEALRQVLLNLCLNALQAMGTKGGALRVRMSEGEGSRLRLTVEDSGPGVPPDDREAIFRPFHTTKEGGTGLGLPVVAKIVAGCGGTVSVGDAEGGGARFAVELPFAPDGAPTPACEVVG